MKLFSFRDARRSAILIFLLCLSLNIFVSQLLTNYVIEKARVRFEADSQQIQSQISDRLLDYEGILLGAKGFFEASGTVDEATWKTYIQSLDIERRNPEILTVGYIKKISDTEKNNYIQDLKNKGFPESAFRTDKTKDFYFPVTYVFSVKETIQSGIGFDMSSEPKRNAALTSARETNQPTLSEKLQLLIDAGKGEKPSFQMYVPIYKKGASIQTVEDRTNNIEGYVFSSFRMDELMDGLFKGRFRDIQVEIYTNDQKLRENLLFSNIAQPPFGSSTSFTTTNEIIFGDKQWHLYYYSTDLFTAETDLNRKYIFPIAAILVTVLLSGIFYFVASSRERAVKMANDIVEKLNTSEQQYKTVVEALEEGVILHDTEGKVLATNKSARAILQVKKKTEEFPDLNAYLEDGKKLAYAEYPFCITGKTHKAQLNVLLEIRRPDVEATWIKMNSLPVFDPDTGEFTRIVTSIEDITKIKIAEKELLNANELLTRSNNELQNFAYVASHDLQEPLRKITSFSNLLSVHMRGRLDETETKYLDIIENAAKRMSILINDLLSFSRITTQGKPFESVNLNKLVEDVLSDLEISIKEKQATIEVEHLCTIDGDAIQLRQLFQNILSNSIKYSKNDSSPHITISSKKKIKENLCTITIEDNGIGFDEKYVEKIFTIFQRLHNKQDYAGTGIGLAICKKIVERHNGTITAQSQEGIGSRFIVAIPIKQ